MFSNKAKTVIVSAGIVIAASGVALARTQSGYDGRAINAADQTCFWNITGGPNNIAGAVNTCGTDSTVKGWDIPLVQDVGLFGATSAPTIALWMRTGIVGTLTCTHVAFDVNGFPTATVTFPAISKNSTVQRVTAPSLNIPAFGGSFIRCAVPGPAGGVTSSIVGPVTY